MDLFPTAYRDAKYDPVFWALAMTMSLGMWAIFMNHPSMPVAAFQLLVCVVMAGWISAMQAQRSSDTAGSLRPAPATTELEAFSLA